MGLGGSSALVKLERGGRTHLPRRSQSGDPGLPHYQESQAAKESQVGTHNTVELEHWSGRGYVEYTGSGAENSPAVAGARAVPGL